MQALFTYWYLFPIAILIATIAMSSGTDGAIFFSPLFMLGLQLEPKVAIGTALATEIFGFLSGFFAYYRARLIDFRLGFQLMVFAVPTAIAGAFIADYIPDQWLKGIFAIGILVIALQLYRSWKQDKQLSSSHKKHEMKPKEYNQCLTDHNNKTYYYTITHRSLGRTFAAIGGLFVGMMSAGLAEILEYRLVGQCKVPGPVAVATTIMVVVGTVLFASVTHAYQFFNSASPEDMQQVGSIVIFTVPGVLIGGQIGPLVQRRIDEQLVQPILVGLFVILGLIMGSMAILQ